jgi:5-methylcytosine-specific restriction endonuclease McrBC regulatory subunit McrC
MENVPVLDKSLEFKYFEFGDRMSFAKEMKKKLAKYQFNQGIQDSNNKMLYDVDLTIQMYRLGLDLKEKKCSLENLEFFENELLDILSTLLKESIAELEKVANLSQSKN